MKLSVIVAAYNEEKNIHRCLDSLVHQTMRDGLEIIVVNDGSIDKTAEICDKYAEEYDFLKVLHTTNNGQGMARNRGIEEATGDYIGFVDADDWVEIDMFEHLYEEAVIHDSDMVVCDVHKIFDDEQREEDVISLPEPAYSIDIGTYLAYGENNAYSWNKIYRRELWQEYHYEKMV
ncbi:MAG TPA: glycosyl transferase, partial [Erysipelotrichaceae bacterium]|nr:glycosyl transferase [Erysipelotrichaceae bacterium]